MDISKCALLAILHAGKEGFGHAFHTINDVHNHLQGKGQGQTDTTIKYDGSPAVIFGESLVSHGAFYTQRTNELEELIQEYNNLVYL